MRRSASAPVQGRPRMLSLALAGGTVALSCILGATTLIPDTAPRDASLGLMVVDAPAQRAASEQPPAQPEPSITTDQPRRQESVRIEETAAPQRDATRPEQRITFDGRRLEKVRDITMTVTAYSPDARSCGKWADGITASGYSVWTNGMKLVAADTDLLPMKTIVTVPGYNDDKPVQVLDRGGAIKGKRLDVLYPSHESALQWGRQELTVTVWKYAD